MRISRALRPYRVILNGPVLAEFKPLITVMDRVNREMHGSEYIYIKHAAGPTTSMAFGSIREALDQSARDMEIYRYLPSRIERISKEIKAPKGYAFIVSFAYYIPDRSQVKFAKPRKQEFLS